MLGSVKLCLSWKLAMENVQAQKSYTKVLQLGEDFSVRVWLFE